MSYPTVQGRAVEGLLFREAQSCLGKKFANSFYQFTLSGTSTPTNVYQNGALTTPFPITGKVTSDSFGRFPAIYLDPSIIYRVQFFNSSGSWLVDPYVSQLSTVGTSSLSAFGLRIAPTGEVVMPAPNTGGSGLTLTLNASVLGTTPLRLNGTVPGTSALIINSAVTTGAQTATFVAANKPGTATSAPAGWLPITCDGVQYYTPIWHGNPFTPYTPPPTNALIHIFTTPGSATEIIPAGKNTIQMEVWGGGGGGGGVSGSFGGRVGGTGGLSYSVYTVSSLGGSGLTLNYTVPAGGAGGLSGGATGSTGSAGSITAGTVTGFSTMTANGGVGGQNFLGSPGVGGTASGGNSSNITGTTGSTIGLTGFISGDGSPYGGGGISSVNGQNGAIVFYYT